MEKTREEEKMKLPTAESLLKENHEMTPKDIWWELRETIPEYVKEWQTSFPQMMNQIKLLAKENKIMLTDDGTYIWIDISDNPKLQKLFDESVPLK